MAALLTALHALGAPAVVELAHAMPRTVAGGELWIVGSGSGTLDVAGAAAVMTDGIARLDTPRAAAAPVRRHERRRDRRAWPSARPKP